MSIECAQFILCSDVFGDQESRKPEGNSPTLNCWSPTWHTLLVPEPKKQNPTPTFAPWTHHYLLLPLVLFYDYESHHQLIHQNSKFVFLIDRSETNQKFRKIIGVTLIFWSVAFSLAVPLSAVGLVGGSFLGWILGWRQVVALVAIILPQCWTHSWQEFLAHDGVVSSTWGSLARTHILAAQPNCV